jgi:hypothetical protein
VGVQAYLGASLTSRIEPAVSNVPKLGDLVDSLTRWDKFLVRYPLAVKKIKVVLTLVLTFSRSWGRVSLKSFIACSATLFEGHVGNPSFQPQ